VEVSNDVVELQEKEVSRKKGEYNAKNHTEVEERGRRKEHRRREEGRAVLVKRKSKEGKP